MRYIMPCGNWGGILPTHINHLESSTTPDHTKNGGEKIPGISPGVLGDMPRISQTPFYGSISEMDKAMAIAIPLLV